MRGCGYFVRWVGRGGVDGKVGGYVCLVATFAWSGGDFHCVRMRCGVVDREGEVGGCEVDFTSRNTRGGTRRLVSHDQLVNREKSQIVLVSRAAKSSSGTA